VTVTNYCQREHGDPEVQVGFAYEGQQVTGFIDARRQNDGVWEEWGWFSYDEDGWRATRKDWIQMDAHTVLTIDDVPPRTKSPSRQPPARPTRPTSLLTRVAQTPESAHDGSACARRANGADHAALRSRPSGRLTGVRAPASRTAIGHARPAAARHTAHNDASARSSSAASVEPKP
jgi:hypothetical protein